MTDARSSRATTHRSFQESSTPRQRDPETDADYEDREHAQRGRPNAYHGTAALRAAAARLPAALGSLLGGQVSRLEVRRLAKVGVRGPARAVGRDESCTSAGVSGTHLELRLAVVQAVRYPDVVRKDVDRGIVWDDIGLGILREVGPCQAARIIAVAWLLV